MTKRDDTSRNSSFSDESTVGRRGYLRAVGAAAASVASVATCGLVAGEAKPYTTVERDGYTEIIVEPGGLWRTDVGSGETLSNLLVDVSASGANAMIKPRGDGWTVRNVGFKGRIDAGWPEKRILPGVDAGGHGTIENVYLGDGSGNGRQGGIFVMRDHAGELDIRGCNVQGWADNGIYASAPGKSTGSGGTVAIEDCFAKNNNTASFRIGTHGSSVRNSVVHIDGDAPSMPAKRGSSSGRAIWAWTDESGTGGGPYEISNVDIAIESAAGTWSVGSYPDAISGTLATMRDSNWKGGTGLDDGIVAENVGKDPNVTPPAAVPMSAEAAARGGSSDGDGGGSDATTQSAGPTQTPLDGNATETTTDTITSGTPTGGTTTIPDSTPTNTTEAPDPTTRD